MTLVTYPAVWILSAVRKSHEEVSVLAFADEVMENDDQAFARRQMYSRLERSGGLPYSYRLAPVEKVQEAVVEARVRREVEAGLRFSIPKVCLSCEHTCSYFGEADYAEECQRASDAREDAENRRP